MAKEVNLSRESQARIDHRAWLEDYRRWRSEHRQALTMLVKVQAIILERDAVLESQAAEVESHELELQKYDQIGIEQFHPDPETQLSIHAEFTRKHERAREAYERTKSDHVNLVEEVEKLFKICRPPTRPDATWSH